MPNEADELLTKKDIARMLKVHLRSVTRWDKQGLLPPASFRLGKLKRWTRAVIEAWIRLGGPGEGEVTKATESGQRRPKVDKKGQMDG